MKTTALFRPYTSGSGFLLSFMDIEKPTSEQFLSYLQSNKLTDQIASNFADQTSKQLGFETRVSSPEKLRELELTIKEFCHFYRITYRTEPMKSSRSDDYAQSQAG